MANLNEARAQLHFERKKAETLTEDLQAQLNESHLKVKIEQAKLADAKQKQEQSEAQVQTLKEELNLKRNQMFELHNTISMQTTKTTMQNQEAGALLRRIQDCQSKETVFLQEKQKLTGERDLLQFQMASLAAELNTQKSAAVL